MPLSIYPTPTANRPVHSPVPTPGTRKLCPQPLVLKSEYLSPYTPFPLFEPQFTPQERTRADLEYLGKIFVHNSLSDKAPAQDTHTPSFLSIFPQSPITLTTYILSLCEIPLMCDFLANSVVNSELPPYLFAVQGGILRIIDKPNRLHLAGICSGIIYRCFADLLNLFRSTKVET